MLKVNGGGGPNGGYSAGEAMPRPYRRASAYGREVLGERIRVIEQSLCWSAAV